MQVYENKHHDNSTSYNNDRTLTLNIRVAEWRYRLRHQELLLIINTAVYGGL